MASKVEKKDEETIDSSETIIDVEKEQGKREIEDEY